MGPMSCDGDGILAFVKSDVPISLMHALLTKRVRAKNTKHAPEQNPQLGKKLARLFELARSVPTYPWACLEVPGHHRLG